MSNLQDIDFQELMNLVKANEDSTDFDLTSFVSDCRTFGCLVGNHFLKSVDTIPLWITRKLGNKQIISFSARYHSKTINILAS